jgi:DNA-directed RNA polymerase specialized sigma24 family protein
MSNDVDGARVNAGLMPREWGDPAALVRFATRWWVPVYRMCWNMLGNPSEAAAATEETLLREIRSARPADASLRISLYRLATWFALVRRRSGVRPAGRRTRIREALDQLDDLDRAAVLLRDVERLAVDDVATILGTSAEDVRGRVHRARLLLIARIHALAPASCEWVG